MNVPCPLSKGLNTVLIERIASRDLIVMASKMVGSDISSEFKGVTDIDFCRCNDCDLQFFYPMVTGSEGFYQKLQVSDWYYKENKKEYEYARQFVRPGHSVLDVGCGRGAFRAKLSTETFVGLELNSDAIRAALERGVRVIKESIQEHSCSNRGVYDVVCAFQVLEHVADTHSFIEASLACLKPDGLLIYSVPSDDSFLALGTNFVTNLPPHHVTRWSDKCLRNVAEIFTLKLVALEHERMADDQTRIYAATVLSAGLERLAGGRARAVNRTFRHRAIAKLASAGARILAQGLSNPGVLPRGHVVTAVYQKPDGAVPETPKLYIRPY
jgi:2-polyprenyl-3-methyl-5-hydroxy-6-metoxy-1,4-benzoquinol methylase